MCVNCLIVADDDVLHSGGDVLRTGFAVASDLVDRARGEAAQIIAEAERRSDLIVVEAERSAAAKRGEGDLYLSKARAVLEIAQQRAALRPVFLDLVDSDSDTDSDSDSDSDTDSDIEVELLGCESTPDHGAVPRGDPLPGEFERLLREAVASAVAASVASSR